MARFCTALVGVAYWASYFINGDASGLEEGEQAKADAWLERNQIRNVIDCADEAHFTWHMRLYAPELDCDGGDVIDYTVEGGF